LIRFLIIRFEYLFSFFIDFKLNFALTKLNYFSQINLNSFKNIKNLYHYLSFFFIARGFCFHFENLFLDLNSEFSDQFIELKALFINEIKLKK
jgi:hypothetical protein